MDEGALAQESVGLLRERSLEERGHGLTQATGKALDGLVFTMAGFLRRPAIAGAPEETDDALRKRVLMALQVNLTHSRARLVLGGVEVATGWATLSDDSQTLHMDVTATLPASCAQIEFSSNVGEVGTHNSAQDIRYGDK